MKQEKHIDPEEEKQPGPTLIDVGAGMNIQSLIVVGLRLTAINFLLRVIIELSTPLLIFAGVYRRTGDGASATVGWILVGALFVGAVVLWALALPFARLVARGLPGEIALGDLSLSDFYSLGFVLVGLFYVISHLAGVWNWTTFLFQSLIHGPHYPWGDSTRRYEIASIFIPFVAGIILLIKHRKWAVALAGKKPERTLISLNDPWQKGRSKARDTVTISIGPPQK